MTKIRKQRKMPGGNRGDRSSRAKAGGWDICSEKATHCTVATCLKYLLRLLALAPLHYSAIPVHILFVVNGSIL
jgi:hypothetical protein